jgi:hypothetical protein
MARTSALALFNRQSAVRSLARLHTAGSSEMQEVFGAEVVSCAFGNRAKERVMKFRTKHFRRTKGGSHAVLHELDTT